MNCPYFSLLCLSTKKIESIAKQRFQFFLGLGLSAKRFKAKNGYAIFSLDKMPHQAHLPIF